LYFIFAAGIERVSTLRGRRKSERKKKEKKRTSV
jgi:hypothetical protein